MRKRRPITSYGRVVLARLEAKHMSLFELAQEVERRTGKFCTEEYIQKYIRECPHRGPRIWRSGLYWD